MHRSTHSFRHAALGAVTLGLAVTAGACGGAPSGPSDDVMASHAPDRADLVLTQLGPTQAKPNGTFSSCLPASTYRDGVWVTVYSVHATTKLTITSVSAGAGAPAPQDVALVRIAPRRAQPSVDPSAAKAAQLVPHRAWADRSRLIGDGVSLSDGEDAVLTFREPLKAGQSFRTDQVSLSYRDASGNGTVPATGITPETITVATHC